MSNEVEYDPFEYAMSSRPVRTSATVIRGPKGAVGHDAGELLKRGAVGAAASPVPAR